MRRKFVQPALPNLYFKDDILSVPGYTFQKATKWHDTGSQTQLAEGTSLKDGTHVIAKIAPATGTGSICLEREAHLINRLAEHPETTSTTFRFIDFLSLPHESGECVILLLTRPGLNLLGRYFPSSRVNELLLAEPSKSKPIATAADVYMMGMEHDLEMDMDEEHEQFDVMDLATFLEFAIQATHCLEMLHKLGLIHREVRANAFHLNAHSGLVRFAHFGNRSVSLEQLGGPSALVIQADSLEDVDKRRVKEALCYLAPEQTGSFETSMEDQRTDLYSLGVMFWTLLVGQGILPFEGSPMEILHGIVHSRPVPVHGVRRDVPQVLSLIIEKLLSKSPDARYYSAYGLKSDLLECQKRLLASVSSMSDQPAEELIAYFDIGLQDKFVNFTIPSTLYGREKELDLIRGAIRRTTSSNSRYNGSYKGSISLSGSSQQTSTAVGTMDDIQSESASTRSESSLNHVSTTGGVVATDASPRLGPTKLASVNESGEAGAMAGPSSASASASQASDVLRRSAWTTSRSRNTRTRCVIIVGPAGAGKSSLIMVNQAKWRAHGLWGHAKFQNSATSPFAALLSCLSSVLRQLMVFQSDLDRFVNTLKARLGPQLQNAPLLYEGTPELKDILNLFDVETVPQDDHPSSFELRARFQTLVEQVFSVLAEVRMLALFLDDLHEADESSLDLIMTLANARSRMLILGSVRSEERTEGISLARIKAVFSSKSRVTWIHLEPLTFSAIGSLVSRTLHTTKEECAPLSRLVHRLSSGNAFSARNLLLNFQRHHHIVFDWDSNRWTYDLSNIEASLMQTSVVDPGDLTYLGLHFNELPLDARKYLIWASFFGASFKATEVALMMDWADSSSGSSSEDDGSEAWVWSRAIQNATIKEASISTTRGSMRGLQVAITEGWLVQRARDMCSFSHDRYRQAATMQAQKLPEDERAKMSFRIVLMAMDQTPPDAHRVAEHAKRSLNVIRNHSKRAEILTMVHEAALAAWTRGAHELALESLLSAQALLIDDDWVSRPRSSYSLLLQLAELLNWKGEIDASDTLLTDVVKKAELPEEKAKALRLRSRNHFFRKDFKSALQDTLEALHLLGVEVDPSPSRRDADIMFEQVKNEILAVGFDDILSIPRATDPKVDLTVQLLNDAGTNAYWSSGHGFADIIGLTTIQVALRSGMCPGTALGFFWALGAAAERRELYRFSADLGKLALRIAEKYGSSSEKCRAHCLYVAMVSGYDNVHLRANLTHCDAAIKYGLSSGDRVYTGLSAMHYIITRLYICEHLSELVGPAEETMRDIAMWTPDSDTLVLMQGVLNCIRALGGYTIANSAETIFDTNTFTESEYISEAVQTAGNVPLVKNWYDSFKLVSLFCLGHVEEAAELGFGVYATLHHHPNHRHARYALCYHSLAMIGCMRYGNCNEDKTRRYRKQVELNQGYVRKWLSPSPVNTCMWIALVDAEFASLNDNPDAFKLYDVAVKLAVNNDWLLEEGWALYLQGCHFVRCGVENLGGELQRRGIGRHSQWGARGIVNHLNSVVGTASQHYLKRNIFSADVAVQTDSVVIGLEPAHELPDDAAMEGITDETAVHLGASELSSILRWSKDISSDINLSSALRRLTEIIAENSGCQNISVVIAREAGDYTVATTMRPPDPCQVHENPKPIHRLTDSLERAIMQYCLAQKSRVIVADAALDSRFVSAADGSIHRSVLCLPISSNRGQMFGLVYLATNYPFSQSTIHVLTLLLQQASISIANAMLFRSVQAGTRENLKMISSQRAALEQARRSREDALKATKIKSNFLASMSHELRTPFSSFYGLLDLLSGTELNPGQREIVDTAKQSCELLLRIIDSILDYSKLEASALKLEFSGFPVENIIADCMELLLPMAVKKLDMSFNIEPDVPSWVMADYARIRQVLMNLIGNGVKFTESGYVRVICSVDRPKTPPTPVEVVLKFVIQDTGIGLSPSDVELLFRPFQQADNSSTRKFGGTGLGLSISRQLVKLMGGDIGVESLQTVGSTFWFTIPVKIFESDESRKATSDLQHLRSLLTQTRPLRILACSTSDATRSLLSNMLTGFSVTTASSIEEIEARLLDDDFIREPLDFIIVDHQSESRVDELSHFLQSLRLPTTENTKMIHLYTPTSATLAQAPTWGQSENGLVRMTKPPRCVRLLQMLAELKGVSSDLPTMPSSEVAKAVADLSVARRKLFGNVLVAEDNVIAQKLLVKQLERYQLNVTATSNGSEAVTEWEQHEPGYFGVALFDHHMPICDGIEAAKRIRLAENRRKDHVRLPIVALSADCQESTKQLCLSAGMNAFLSKPLRKDDLLALLQHSFNTFDVNGGP